MPTDPLTCVSHSLNAKYHYSSDILQGVQLTYFENTPAIQNSTPPPSIISGHGPYAINLELEEEAEMSNQPEVNFLVGLPVISITLASCHVSIHFNVCEIIFQALKDNQPANLADFPANTTP